MEKGYDKGELQAIISKFIYFACAKDLFYLNGDERYLENEKHNDGTIYVCGNYTIYNKCYADNSLEYKANREEALKDYKKKECEDRNWLHIIDKTCKSKLEENFIPLILKRTNTAIDSIKRPSSFNELDIKTLINVVYNRDLRKEQLHLQWLGNLMYRDNNIIIQTLYDEIKKTIKYLDKKQNQSVTFAAIIGLIIATEKSSSFPQTLTDAYNIFYNEVFSILSSISGYIILQSPAFYPIIYFNKMPNKFFKVFPIVNSGNGEYDLRIEIQNILKDCVNNDKWILENYFDERTLQILCCFVLTDCFFREPIKITDQAKFEFAFCLFLLIIKLISKKTLESSEVFWENNLIAIFMVCCINNTECKTLSANKMKDSMLHNTPFELDKKSIRNEVIEKLKTTENLDFMIFIFIIANQIKDQELLDLVNNKDEIKALAFDNSCKVKDLIIKIKDSEIEELLQSIDNYFIYRTSEDANILVSILKKTHNDLETSYNENLTSAIHNMINSDIKYEDIYNEVKNKINLKTIKENAKKRIYELISTGEYLLKVTDMSNYSPAVNQYCSALERLLNEIIYMPYFFEIQNICLKNKNRYFARDDIIRKKYFGDKVKHAMYFKNNELSVMSLGELKSLMENILNDNERLDIFKKATKSIFNNIDIKLFFKNICGGIDIIKSDRDKSSHGELINRDGAERIRAKVYKNDSNEKLNPSDLILKIDKDLN